MISLKLDKKVLSLVGAIAGLFFILAVFVYLPLIGKVSRGYARWKGIVQELGASEADLRALSQEAHGKKFILPQEASSVIDNITSLGKASGLDFKSIARKEIKYSSSGYPVLPLEMEIGCEYEQFGRFLGGIKELKEAMVSAEGFRMRPEVEQSSRLIVSLALNIYLSKTTDALD